MKYCLVTLLLLLTCSSADPQALASWKGFVTDTHCGTNCQRTAHMTPDRTCVRLCIKRGSKYGLWYKDHVYVLEPQSQAAPFAAESVRITGTRFGDSIRIATISPIPESAEGPSRKKE